MAEFSERGHASATTKSIAERAGVATGSFYQYFENKDVILREIARRRFEGIVDRALAMLPSPRSDDPPQRIRASLQAIVALVIALHRDDPGLHTVLTERRHVDEELDAITTNFEHAIMDRIVEWLGIWRPGIDGEATAFVLFGMLEGAVHTHVLGHPRVSDLRFVEALVDALARIVIR